MEEAEEAPLKEAAKVKLTSRFRFMTALRSVAIANSNSSIGDSTKNPEIRVYSR